MYVSDYGWAAEHSAWKIPLLSYRNTTENWMYMGLNEWTLIRHADDTTFVHIIYEDGSVYTSMNVYRQFVVRPVFNLNSSVSYRGGSGTSSEPFIIE